MANSDDRKVPQAKGGDELPNPKQFYIDWSLYQSVALTDDNLAHYFNLLYYGGTLDCYCVYCKSESIFHSNLTETERGMPSAAEAQWKRLQTAVTFAPIGSGRSRSEAVIRNSISSAYRIPAAVLVRTFLCGRNALHKLEVIFGAGPMRITKIGQFPSAADLVLPSESRYAKILGPQYAELRRAVGLHAHGIGIGAFVYLRRIFESLVNDAYLKHSAREKWSAKRKKEYSSARMSERIKMLEGSLPIFLVSNAKLYGILSTAVHSLTEDECLAHFETVRAGIDLILEERAAELEKKQRESTAKGAITDLAEKLRKGKSRP